MTKPIIDRADTISRICQALAAGRRADACAIARQEYPFEPPRVAAHGKCTPLQKTQVFMDDGFIDRYFGNRLVFPGALQLLSRLMPEELPSHPNWKMSVGHMVYWDLYPTIDHVDPIAHGGVDDKTNWVSTSMLHNAIKDHWTLEELGWVKRPPGDLKVWDGMIHWYLETAAANLLMVATGSARSWYFAAKRILKAETSNGIVK
jgi:hypothetical protein